MLISRCTNSKYSGGGGGFVSRSDVRQMCLGVAPAMQLVFYVGTGSLPFSKGFRGLEGISCPLAQPRHECRTAMPRASHLLP